MIDDLIEAAIELVAWKAKKEKRKKDAVAPRGEIAEIDENPALNLKKPPKTGDAK